jgi:hypothetical protein
MVVRVYTGGEHEPENDDGRGADSAPGTAAPAEGGADDPRPERDRPAPRDPALDPRLYAVGDEPLAPGWPVDYRYLYDLVLDRFEREEERVKSLDGKLAALLAGVVASIGFSFRTQLNVASAGAAMLYLIPLGLIAWAYTIHLEKFAPTAEALQASFPAYPVSTLVEAIEAMRIANAANVGVHDRKAAVLDRAVVATLAVTLVVLVMQLFIALRNVHDETSIVIAPKRHAAATNATIRKASQPP